MSRMGKAMSEAERLAMETSDAYSSGRYASWKQCAAVLFKMGYSYKEAEAILRSKWTRWAADVSGKAYGKATSGDLKMFIEDPKNKCTDEAVKGLVEGTY